MSNFYDKNGKEIRERACLKVFHFIGSRHKKHYMYKWVIVRNDKLFALHSGILQPEESDGFYISFLADKKSILKDVEVVDGFVSEC